ncbi:hypothetical protein [Burkholderia sp. WP9]|uniref:hypothetical protein n=1 Tax=Burkholderia sp. WP9 TaxID=1500263 RepID=UPI0015A5F513|nr:hypothetical protein [Burkholderia sp. WP9]
MFSLQAHWRSRLIRSCLRADCPKSAIVHSAFGSTFADGGLSACSFIQKGTEISRKFIWIFEHQEVVPMLCVGVVVQFCARYYGLCPTLTWQVVALFAGKE